MKKWIVSAVLAISVLANVLMGVILFRRAHIAKTDDRYGSYSMVYPLLNQATENANWAAQGKNISTNLFSVHTNVYWTAGILRGLQYDGTQVGIGKSEIPSRRLGESNISDAAFIARVMGVSHVEIKNFIIE
jgi:hypothetical protein